MRTDTKGWDEENTHGSADNKQHINLSDTAMEVLYNDIHSFMGRGSVSGFINRILRTYGEQAQASLSRAQEREREQLREQLLQEQQQRPFTKLRSVPAAEKDMIIDAICSAHTAQRLAVINAYPAGAALKFRLNKENFESLYVRSGHPERRWYRSRGKYIKAILEEYARKTPLEREAIYFGDWLETIEVSIESGRLLQVTSQQGNIFEVKPYALLTDAGGMYYYLVGLSVPRHAEQAEEKVASFRVSRLRDVTARPKSYRSGRLTLAEKEKIKKALQEKGVQFLLQQKEEIVLRLDRQGSGMFNAQLHLRPVPTKRVELPDGGGEYHFDCTQTQIDFYFFKFGEHVEILSPADLRESFREKYRSAWAVYEGSSIK